jgi:hypothetical protein
MDVGLDNEKTGKVAIGLDMIHMGEEYWDMT